MCSGEVLFKVFFIKNVMIFKTRCPILFHSNNQISKYLSRDKLNKYFNEVTHVSRLGAVICICYVFLYIIMYLYCQIGIFVFFTTSLDKQKLDKCLKPVRREYILPLYSLKVYINTQ